MIGENSNKLKFVYTVNPNQEWVKNEVKSRYETLANISKVRQLTEEEQKEYNSIVNYTLTSQITNKNQSYVLGYFENDIFYMYTINQIHNFRPQIEGNFKNSNVSIHNISTSLATHSDLLQNSSEAETAFLQSELSTTKRKSTNNNFGAQQNHLNERYQNINYIFQDTSVEMNQMVTYLKQFEIPRALQDKTENFRENKLDQLNNSQSEKNIIKKTKPLLNKNDLNWIIKIFYSTNNDSYLQKICTNNSSSSAHLGFNKNSEGLLGVGPLSYTALRKLSIDDQVLRILRMRGHCYFKNMKTLVVMQNYSDNALIDVLKKYGVVLHGIWFCKSNLLIENNSKWYEIEIRVRDIVLCLFNKTKAVEIEKLGKLVKLPIKRLDSILKGMFKKVDEKYISCLEPDKEFPTLYPTVCSFFEDIYSPARAQQNLQELNELMVKMTENSLTQNSNHEVFRALDFVQCNYIVKNILLKKGAMDEAVLLDGLKCELLKQTTPDSNAISEIDQNTQIELQNQTKLINSIKTDILPLLLNNEAIKINTHWVITSSGRPNIEPFRKILINYYLENYQRSITIQEFNVYCAYKNKTPCDLPDLQLRALFNELAYNDKGSWYFKGYKKPKIFENLDDNSNYPS